MKFLLGSLLVASFLSQIAGQATASAIPSCSLQCLTTLVPEFCGSMTNTTCLCTDATLTAELGLCALAACNVTETFRLQKYKADVCGVVNDESRLKRQIDFYAVLPALVTVFLALRMYTRASMETIGYDDWMMVAAYLSFMLDIVFGVMMVVNKFGTHTYQLSTKQMEDSLMYFYICEIWYMITITLTKLSLLLFFKRIFPQRNFTIASWIVGGYTAISNFAMLMAITFQCIPFHGSWTNWEYKVYPVKCIDTYAAVYVAAGNNIVQDLVIMLMPIPILMNLQLAWQKKANLLVMFSVGTFVILCSVLRLPSLIKLKTSQDPSWDQAPIAAWTTLEQSIGIICGCLPAFRSLISHHFPALKMNFVKRSIVTPPTGYSSYSSKRKATKQLDETGGHSFVELHDRDGRISDPNDSDEYMTQTVKSHESKWPIVSEVPEKYGPSIDIHAGTPRKSIKSYQGIVMTREIDQSSSRS